MLIQANVNVQSGTDWYFLRAHQNLFCQLSILHNLYSMAETIQIVIVFLMMFCLSNQSNTPQPASCTISIHHSIWQSVTVFLHCTLFKLKKNIDIHILIHAMSFIPYFAKFILVLCPIYCCHCTKALILQSMECFCSRGRGECYHSELKA